MDPNLPAGTPSRTAPWTLPFGLLTGAGVMGLVWACLAVVDPASDTAWLVPLIGIPVALVIAALVPARRGGPFRDGMALGALAGLAVFFGLLAALWGGA